MRCTGCGLGMVGEMGRVIFVVKVIVLTHKMIENHGKWAQWTSGA